MEGVQNNVLPLCFIAGGLFVLVCVLLIIWIRKIATLPSTSSSSSEDSDDFSFSTSDDSIGRVGPSTGGIAIGVGSNIGIDPMDGSIAIGTGSGVFIDTDMR